MLGLPPAGAALRRVTLHSADPDALRVRQRFERVLAGVEWRPASLSASALLIVRRLAPQPTAQQPFGQRISLELQHYASRARRPWIHADAGQADAVLFADEAELVACLAHDVLRGAVGERWWWRSVLGNAGVSEWFRQHAFLRGDVLAPAIALLAARGEATAWIDVIEEADAIQAFESIICAYDICARSGPMRTAKPRAAQRRNSAERTAWERAKDRSQSVALTRLRIAVPEIGAAANQGLGRRLLAAGLAVIRMPGWTRTVQFAAALEALEYASDSRAYENAATQVPDAHAAEGRHHPATGAFPASMQRANASQEPTISTRELLNGPLSVQQPRVGREPRFRATRAGETRAFPRLPDAPGRTFAEEPPITTRAAPPVTHAVTVDTRQDVAAGPPLQPAERPIFVEQPRIATEFGGTFYLLNAALALGLYGDFTAPRAKGLALPPWDWLALVGRACFGKSFVRDPVWDVLAGLGGRTLKDEPGRHFVGPHTRRSRLRTRRVTDRWLRRQLGPLRARLALALGTDNVAEVASLVCCHPAEVVVTASRVEVHLALADLPLAIRIAGLDRDTGWIPAAGRSVSFHFT